MKYVRDWFHLVLYWILGGSGGYIQNNVTWLSDHWVQIQYQCLILNHVFKQMN